ncbi:hypothetical protein DFH08DRAFT_832131, partial [Mycena albidolilacea]
RSGFSSMHIKHSSSSSQRLLSLIFSLSIPGRATAHSWGLSTAGASPRYSLRIANLSEYPMPGGRQCTKRKNIHWGQ